MFQRVRGATSLSADGQVSAALKLSEAVAEFLRRQAERGIRQSTLTQFRLTAWSVIEFVGCDSPRRELPEDLPARYVEWLRTTPIAPRKSGTLPKTISPESVRAFFMWPPRKKKADGKQREEQTIGRYWRHAAPLFQWLGLGTELHRDDRPNMALPPPLVPMRSDVADWWRDCLTAACACPVTASGLS